MRLKIQRQVSERAAKRSKWMIMAVVIMVAVNYISDQTIESILNESYTASADIQEEGDDNEIVIVDEYENHRRLADLDYNCDEPKKTKFHDVLCNEIVPKETEEFYTLKDGETWKPTDSSIQVAAEKFKYKHILLSANGFVEEFHYKESDDFCNSFVIIPGTSLLGKGTLGVAYGAFLGYLFVGISIIADIFMEAIEVITSKTVQVEMMDDKTKTRYIIEQPVWNATFANLTLMALGSSAPEILLNVIETLGTLGQKAGPLGASTIVGSAAFNLLVISAVSIIAIGEKPKKIFDLGVFFVTATFSIFAYLWLYITLTIWSPNQIDVLEAWITLLFFPVVVILAFGADKFNQKVQDEKNSKETEKIDEENQKKQQQKYKLRQFASKKGELYVIQIAQGIQTSENEVETREIKQYFIDILGEDPVKVPVKDLIEVLQPETLLERFAARKQNQIGATKEFVKIKGQKGQVENMTPGINNPSELLGFRCLHYSVTESSGTIDITIIKKVENQEITFGIRTKDDTAKAQSEYESVDDVITLKKRDNEHNLSIKIFDNNEWQPDLDFYIELYDPNTFGRARYQGDDTQTKITILDEDFPGTLGFAQTEVSVSKFSENVSISIVRSEGSDGKISCMIRTEPYSEDLKQQQLNATEFEDYLPKHETVEFDNGENEKTVFIDLVHDKHKQGRTQGEKGDLDSDDAAEEGDPNDDNDVRDIMFKVKIEKPHPVEVKISKRNICVVKISQSDDVKRVQDEHAKLVQYFIQSQQPDWLGQFRTAVELGPMIDDENMILDDVTLYEAFVHFTCIGWKLIFAFVPPAKMGGGIPCFLIALCFIGVITAIVAEVATILGCVINLKGSVTAITLVAMGTSLPDTFASVTAAQSSEYADSAIGNVTGSNCVNVFLGLGLPWVIATHYKQSLKAQNPNDDSILGSHEMEAGDLAFSVVLFICTSITCFIVLIIRRVTIGGELGGPNGSKYISGAFLFSLWVIYVLFSSLKAYGLLG